MKTKSKIMSKCHQEFQFQKIFTKCDLTSWSMSRTSNLYYFLYSLSLSSSPHSLLMLNTRRTENTNGVVFQLSWCTCMYNKQRFVLPSVIRPTWYTRTHSMQMHANKILTALAVESHFNHHHLSISSINGDTHSLNPPITSPLMSNKRSENMSFCISFHRFIYYLRK